MVGLRELVQISVSLSSVVARFAAAAEAKQFMDWSVEGDEHGLEKIMPWTRYAGVGLIITMLIMPQMRSDGGA